MKKIGLILVALVLALATVSADDKIVSAESLPQKAKDFIAANFAGKTVQYAEKDFTTPLMICYYYKSRLFYRKAQNPIKRM